MKITPIYSYTLLNTNPNKQHLHYLFIKNADVFCKNNVNFCAGKKQPTSDYENFMEQFQSVYGNTPLEEIVASVVETNQELDHGKDKRIYVFPKMEDYVIAYMYKLQPSVDLLPIKETQKKYPKYNFGEPFATNGHNIFIENYIDGTPSSISNYHDSSRYISENNHATRDMAKEYLSKLRLFEAFPQEAYDDLAQQFKYLAERGQFADIINPSNLLIDTKNKRFQLIDLLSDEENKHTSGISRQVGGVKQGAFDMINLLLDPRFQCYYLDEMSQDEFNETVNISKNVIEKCFAAASKEGMEKSNRLVFGIFNGVFQIKKYLGINFFRRYEDFLKLYKLQ